jgi:hypothetical protein
MRGAKAVKRGDLVDHQSLACSFAELRANERSAIIGEANQALVERGIPEGREEQTVVDVETLLVAAVRPGDDVGGSKQRRIGDAGQGAAAAPIIYANMRLPASLREGLKRMQPQARRSDKFPLHMHYHPLEKSAGSPE